MLEYAVGFMCGFVAAALVVRARAPTTDVILQRRAENAEFGRDLALKRCEYLQREIDAHVAGTPAVHAARAVN